MNISLNTKKQKWVHSFSISNKETCMRGTPRRREQGSWRLAQPGHVAFCVTNPIQSIILLNLIVLTHMIFKQVFKKTGLNQNRGSVRVLVLSGDHILTNILWRSLWSNDRTTYLKLDTKTSRSGFVMCLGRCLCPAEDSDGLMVRMKLKPCLFLNRIFYSSDCYTKTFHSTIVLNV